jgi:hypothetical protein
MTYPYSPGHPDYSSTGVAKFIPQVWSSKTITKWYEWTVLSKITNTDYEGEIKHQGDTVIIRSVPDTTVVDHSIGQTVTYERPVSSSLTLLIDKGKRWAIELDDIVAAQTDLPLLTKFTDDAAQQLKIAIESAFLNDSTIYNGMDSYNTGSSAGRKSQAFSLGVYTNPTSISPVTLTSTNVLDYIIDCGTVLDEALVPEIGRFMLIPPWMSGMIKKSDLKDASLTGDPKSPLRNGLIGSIDRFDLYSSNLMFNYSGSYCIMFGIPYAITFATQITKTDHIPTPSDAFAERVRMLQVYGYKVIKPTGYGVMWAAKG